MTTTLHLAVLAAILFPAPTFLVFGGLFNAIANRGRVA